MGTTARALQPPSLQRPLEMAGDEGGLQLHPASHDSTEEVCPEPGASQLGQGAGVMPVMARAHVAGLIGDLGQIWCSFAPVPSNVPLQVESLN